MPRPKCTEVREFRFTVGDYERREIIKPLGEILGDVKDATRLTKYAAYATAGGVVVLGVGIGVGLYAIGKGIMNMDISQIGDDLITWPWEEESKLRQWLMTQPTGIFGWGAP